jgi:hypothetical protein
MQDELSVTLNEADFIEAYRSPQRSRRQSSLVLLLALALALLIVLLLVRFPSARDAFEHSRLIIGLAGAVILAAALVLALLTAAPALRGRAARNTMENHPGVRDPVHYAFDSESFSVRTTYTQASYPWAQLWDWRESERVLIVLPTPRNFYVLPKRGVDPAVLDRLRGYLAHARKRVRSGSAS